MMMSRVPSDARRCISLLKGPLVLPVINPTDTGLGEGFRWTVKTFSSSTGRASPASSWGYGCEMLFCKDLCGDHYGTLITAAGSYQKGCQGNHRLPAPHLALEKPVHGGSTPLHIGHDLPNAPLLGSR